jgi:hypothetical protein
LLLGSAVVADRDDQKKTSLLEMTVCRRGEIAAGSACLRSAGPNVFRFDFALKIPS